jgi:hypothetical protein
VSPQSLSGAIPEFLPQPESGRGANSLPTASSIEGSLAGGGVGAEWLKLHNSVALSPFCGNQMLLFVRKLQLELGCAICSDP